MHLLLKITGAPSCRSLTRNIFPNVLPIPLTVKLNFKHDFFSLHKPTLYRWQLRTTALLSRGIQIQIRRNSWSRRRHFFSLGSERHLYNATLLYPPLQGKKRNPLRFSSCECPSSSAFCLLPSIFLSRLQELFRI